MTAEYRQTVEEVVGALGSDALRGLTATEARARLAQYGPNQLTAERAVPAWKKFLAQFKDVLVFLLLIATTISAALWWYERDAALPYEAMAISAVVLLNAILGYVQQERAQSAIAALRQMAAARAHVGAVMSVGTLYVLDAALPGGPVQGVGTMRHAQAMTFTTLMLFQLFNLFNARSDEESALRGLLVNRWLLAAIALSVMLQVCVVYTPFLQRAFATESLTLADWLRCTAVASSVLWMREIQKAFARLKT